MKLGVFSEAFDKLGSRNTRLVLSLIFITIATVIIMTLFEMVKMISDSDITLWKSHLVTILFTAIITPFISLFILVRFERLYRNLVEENEHRKQAGEALRESEKRFKGIYEQAPLGIALINSITGRFLNVNQKYVEIIGRSAEEMQKTTFMAISQPEDLQDDLDNMARLLAGEIKSFRMEKRLFRGDGTIIWVSLTVVSLWEEQEGDFPKLHIAMVDDITERKRAEEELALTQFSLDNFADPCLWSTFDGHIAYVNHAACRALGFTKEELLSMGIPDIDPNYSIGAYRDIWERLKRQGSITIESAHIRKDGSRFPLEASIKYIQFGEREYLISYNRDITERKKTQEEMNEAKERAELYLDLMGHDINNMHQIALGYLELARNMRPEAGENDLLDKPIEVLQRSTQLIRNVRKLQKLKEGVFNLERVDLCTVLEDVQREFRATPHKAITLNMNGCENCLVRANELLHDVFANLVGNAIKHTGAEADIEIDLNIVEDNDGRYCMVIVDDNGPGIPDDVKDNIFNRMKKGTDESKGSGLGLYLVKSLVESYHGKVWVEDRVLGDHTKGARFVVMLPAAEP